MKSINILTFQTKLDLIKKFTYDRKIHSHLQYSYIL